MDIRTKLIFALVAVSLGSMFVLGAVVSPRVEGYIREGTLRQLDQLAEARSDALGWIITGWKDGTDLVASRTQLRASLDEHDRTGSTESADRMRAILADALAASRSAVLMEVLARDGEPVALVERGGVPSVVASLGALPSLESERAVYAGVVAGDVTPPRVTFVAPMDWEGARVGSVVVVYDAPELREVSEDHRGLGETGETLIVTSAGGAGVRTLHPTRHDGGSGAVVALSEAPGGLAARALAGETSVLAGDVEDYRGEEVWAATRPVEETGWGLIVKIDRDEAMRPVVEFNQWLRQTAVILSAFAIVVGLVLALRFALPIHALSEVANRIRRGEMEARADVSREDEVGLLARTFNDMADELERRMEQLHQFRRFFDVTIDLMCIADTNGYFRKTNPAFERELGWNTEELDGRPFLDFVHPDDMEKTLREVTKLAEGIPTISFENRYRCKDGSYKRLRWTSYPEGDVLYAIARVLDGSEGP